MAEAQLSQLQQEYTQLQDINDQLKHQNGLLDQSNKILTQELREAKQQIRDPQLILNHLKEIETDRVDREKKQYKNQQIQKIIDEIAKSIDMCDGSSPSLMRKWLSDIDIAQLRTGSGSHLISIISKTIKGSLKKEIEKHIHNRLADPYDSLSDRNDIDWESLKTHIVKAYLPIDNTSYLRDELDQIRQSPHEEVASYNRRFCDTADEAYPINTRNQDQQIILIKTYAKGLQSSELARELMYKHRTGTIEEAMTHVLQTAAGQDAYKRLGRKEEPMEIGSVSKQVVSPGSIEPLSKAVQQLTTKIAKLEIKQSQMGKEKQFQNQQKSASNRSVYHGTRFQFKCYNCGQPGHIARNCWPWCHYHKSRTHSSNECTALKSQSSQRNSPFRKSWNGNRNNNRNTKKQGN